MSYPAYLNSTERLIAAQVLPLGIEWYEIDGKSLFPYYGASGSLVAYTLAILIGSLSPESNGIDFGTHGLYDNEFGVWHPILFGSMDTREDAQIKIEAALNSIEMAMQKRFDRSGA